MICGRAVLSLQLAGAGWLVCSASSARTSSTLQAKRALGILGSLGARGVRNWRGDACAKTIRARLRFAPCSTGRCDQLKNWFRRNLGSQSQALGILGFLDFLIDFLEFSEFQIE